MTRIGCGKKMVVFIALIVFVVDAVSKAATHHYIPRMSHEAAIYPYGGFGVFKDILGVEFSICHTINMGAAWGVFSDSHELLLAFRVLLISGLVVYWFFFNKSSSLSVPLMLVITGAAANVLDFLFYGHVVDMFHFVLWGYDYPVFNVADMAIFVGIAWIMVLSFMSEKNQRRQAA